MSSVTIKRCPVCPKVGNRAKEVTSALAGDMGLKARIEDGAKGEFSVLVYYIPVIQRNGDSLPSVEEVEAAIRNAVPTLMNV